MAHSYHADEDFRYLYMKAVGPVCLNSEGVGSVISSAVMLCFQVCFPDKVFWFSSATLVSSSIYQNSILQVLIPPRREN